MELLFKQLTIGDRFILTNNGTRSLWTKTDHDQARHHSINSIRLKDNSYGYIGDALATFEEDDLVEFLPVNNVFLY